MADDGALALIGTWRLISCVMEDVETGERKPIWGEHPNGYLVLTPTSRWIVVQTAEERKLPQTDEDRAAAFRSMLAYSGAYRIEGHKIAITVDVAWDEAWNGTEQVRFYKLEGDKLQIEAAPQPYANFGGKVMRGILIWERER
jgi:hypothetical protein